MRKPKMVRNEMKRVMESQPHQDGNMLYADGIPARNISSGQLPGFDVRVYFRMSFAETTQRIGNVVRRWLITDACYYALDGTLLERRVTARPNHEPAPTYEGYVCCLCGADNGLNGEKRLDGRCCKCSNNTVVQRE